MQHCVDLSTHLSRNGPQIYEAAQHPRNLFVSPCHYTSRPSKLELLIKIVLRVWSGLSVKGNFMLDSADLHFPKLVHSIYSIGFFNHYLSFVEPLSYIKRLSWFPDSSLLIEVSNKYIWSDCKVNSSLYTKSCSSMRKQNKKIVFI